MIKELLSDGLYHIIRDLSMSGRLGGGDKGCSFFVCLSKYNSLPDGTIIEINSKAFLIWKKEVFEWSFSGYSKSQIVYDKYENVNVLTPKSYVNTFLKGFVPNTIELIIVKSNWSNLPIVLKKKQ